MHAELFIASEGIYEVVACETLIKTALLAICLTSFLTKQRGFTASVNFEIFIFSFYTLDYLSFYLHH